MEPNYSDPEFLRRRDQILDKFHEVFPRVEKDQSDHIERMDMDQYRKFAAALAPKLARHMEGMTKADLEAQIPKLATAVAVAETILFALEQPDSDQI